MSEREKMRGVFERPKGSGVWWINYYDAGGARHREKVGRRKVAEQAYLQRRGEVREGKFAKPRAAAPLFRDLAAAAIADKKIHRARGTWRHDELRIRAVNDAIGDLRADKVPASRIESLLHALSKNSSRSTANRYRSLMSSVFAFGVRSGAIRENPVARVRKFREPACRVRFLSADEELAIRGVLRDSPAHEAEFDLALYTGMRRGEQFGLRWEDVNLEAKIATVAGKTGHRYVRLNERARAAIKKLWPLSNGLEFVCPDAKRAGQEDWRRWFDLAVKKSGVDNFHWHDLRHTFASRLVMEGVDLATIQKLLGHTTITTTMRYAHLAPGHEQAAVDTLVSTGTQMALSGLRASGE